MKEYRKNMLYCTMIVCLKNNSKNVIFSLKKNNIYYTHSTLVYVRTFWMGRYFFCRAQSRISGRIFTEQKIKIKK